jgi:hypothetical protein
MPDGYGLIPMWRPWFTADSVSPDDDAIVVLCVM